jgi:hypothetical protein
MRKGILPWKVVWRLAVLAAFVAPALAEELKVISARFGLVDYSQPGLRSGDFGIRPVKVIPRKEKYFGWVIEAKCPAGAEQVDWVEMTILPGKYAGARPGKSPDDPTVTMASNLKSFVTRRATVCRGGVARLEDLYAREEGMPAGDWQIEVRSGNQLLATFRFVVE